MSRIKGPGEARVRLLRAHNEYPGRRGDHGAGLATFTKVRTTMASTPWPSRDNLLVLYLDDQAQAEWAAARLAALSHPRVEAENPYWTDNGAITVEDPDHWRVVLMPRPFADGAEPPVTVEWYAGDRDALRPLFELAEDSAAELDSYLHSGRVLVARAGPQIVWHLQLTGTGPALSGAESRIPTLLAGTSLAATPAGIWRTCHPSPDAGVRDSVPTGGPRIDRLS
jgi:hypothetical protein